jgi:hypothetical protein
MAHCLYIDEVGNADLKGAATDDNIRYLSLTGILTTIRHHDERISPQLDYVKSIIPQHSPANPVVLHRRDIVRREGAFACLRNPDLCKKFDDLMLDVIEQAPYRALTVQIDKKQHLDEYSTWHFDPYHYCLRCLIERYVLYLNRHNASGFVAIEPRYKKADKKLKASFERIFLDGTENLTARFVQRRLLSKTIRFFPKSANVAGLQLADLIAHPSARHMRFVRDGRRPPEDFGGRVAEILVRRRYARNPENGTIPGWGTKWLP